VGVGVGVGVFVVVGIGVGVDVGVGVGVGVDLGVGVGVGVSVDTHIIYHISFIIMILICYLTYVLRTSGKGPNKLETCYRKRGAPLPLMSYHSNSCK